jgi:pyrroloquinoline quinone biosynthesis protein D
MTTPLKRSDVRCWEVEGEAVVYDPASGQGHVLNHTALGIWQMCDGEHTVDDIEKILIGAFPDQTSSVKADVQSTIETLVALGLASESAQAA